MAAISAVTYTILKTKKLEDGRLIIDAKLTFGDGSSTYPSGGIPFVLGKLGLRTYISSLEINDTGSSGYQFVPDLTNNKIRMFQGSGLSAHSHALLLKNAAVADGATTRVNAGTNLLGANTGSDITVAGGAANGGVQSVAAGTAAVLPELGTGVAPAAQTIQIMVIGS